MAVVSVIASTFRSFPSASSISTVATDPVLNIPILLNSISSVQIIAVFVETPSATSSSILNTATRTIRRETALASSGSVALFPAIVILQPKPALLTASSGSVTARLISRQKPPCSSSSKEINNSKQVYSAKRNSSSSSIASLVSEIIFRPHPNSLSASQDTCAIRTESRVTVNAIALSSARKAPEMRFVLRVHVNSSSSSNASSIIEISFSILTAFYPMVSSFTNAIAFTRGLQTFAGGAINASELEVVVISDFPDASTEDS